MLATKNDSTKKDFFWKSFLVFSSTICKIWAKKCALLKWQKKRNITEPLEHGVNLLFPMVTKKLAQKTSKKIPQHPLSRKLVYIFKQTSTISWSTPCRVRKSACLHLWAHLEGNQRENPFSQGTNGLFPWTKMIVLKRIHFVSCALSFITIHLDSVLHNLKPNFEGLCFS